jgi:hypothetical protein
MKKSFFVLLLLITCTNLYSQKKNKSQKKQISTSEIVKPIPKQIETIVNNTIVNDATKNNVIVKTVDSKIDLTQKKVKPIECVYFQNYKNDFETYKSTKLYLVFLRSFSGNFERIYFTLAKKNEIPYLNIDLIYKGTDEEYGENICFGEKSKLLIKLKDGKTVSLLHIETEDCYKNVVNGVRDVSRNLSGSFRFLQEDIETLKNSPLETMQIVFENEKKEYAFQINAYSEVENKTFEPQTYFQNYMNCIEN